MLNQAKTLLLVTAITLVVWLFAESESVRSREFTLALELPSDSTASTVMQSFDNQLVRVEVRVTVSGSAVALAALQAAAAKPIKLTPDMEGMPTNAGEREVDFRRVLRPLPMFASRGLAMTRCEPATLRVMVDRIVERPAELRVSVDGLTVETEGAPVLSPQAVRIFGPEQVLAMLPADAVALARPSPAEQARLVPGRADKILGVQLLVPREIAGMDRFVRMEPSRVDLELTVRSKRTTLSLTNVPVQVMLPGLIASQWDVSVEQTFFSDVQASGPGELIEQLRRNELRVFAVVALTSDELEKGVSSKEAVFTTIPAAALTFKSDNPIVKLTVTRRPADAPAKPGNP